MSPQLTLQTPLQLPPTEIPTYLEQLWSHDERGDKGANTFCLIVWQPAWIEQKLVKTGQISGPIVGNQRNDLIEAAREIILKGDLPNSTSPLDFRVQSSIHGEELIENVEDLRGQHIDTSISNLQPRRLITIAPTIDKENIPYWHYKPNDTFHLVFKKRKDRNYKGIKCEYHKIGDLKKIAKILDISFKTSVTAIATCSF